MRQKFAMTQYCNINRSLHLHDSRLFRLCTKVNVRVYEHVGLCAPCLNVPRGRLGTCPTFPDPCGASPSPYTEAKRKNSEACSRVGKQSDSLCRKVNWIPETVVGGIAGEHHGNKCLPATDFHCCWSIFPTLLHSLHGGRCYNAVIKLSTF